MYQSYLCESSKSEIEDICRDAVLLFESALTILPIIYGEKVIYYFDKTKNNTTVTCYNKSNLAPLSDSLQYSNIIKDIKLIPNKINFPGPCNFFFKYF